MLYIPTYISGTYLLYIYEVILSIISLKKERKSFEFFFCFPPMESRIGEEKKGKGKKKEGEEEKGNPFHIVPTYLPRDVSFFFFLFLFKRSGILIYRYM